MQLRGISEYGAVTVALEAASISGSLLIGMVAWQKRNLTEEGWFEHAEWAVAAV